MNKKILSIALVLLFSLNLVLAQVLVDGELRTKFNLENSFLYPAISGEDPEFFTDQRTRIRLNFNQEMYQMRITLQDARIWGDDDMYNKTGTMGNSHALGLYEAWVNFKLSPQAQLKIGRQEWNYYDMRLLASRNWWTSGLTYDGLLYQYYSKQHALSFDLGLSYSNEGLGNGIVDNSNWDGTKLKTLNFVTAQKQWNAYTNTAWLSIVSGKQMGAHSSLLATATHGFLMAYNSDMKTNKLGVFANGSAYYQHGSDVLKGSDGHYRTIQAYMFTGQLGYRMLEKKLELSANVEHLSGRDYSETEADYTNTRHSFDLLDGGRFPYYGGELNHFVIQDSYLTGTKGGAYTNYALKVRYKYSKQSIIEATWHMPYLSSKVSAHQRIDPISKKPTGQVLDATGNVHYWQGSLGHYIDLNHTYKFSKEIILKSGISYGFISDLKNQMAYGYQDVASQSLYPLDHNYYAWMMIIIKPTFFTSK